MTTNGFLSPLSEEHEKQLKALRLHKKFIENVSTLSSGIYDERDTDRSLEGVICTAFAWDKSPEGYDFWEKIFNKLKH